MKHPVIITAAKALAAATLVLSAPFALAGGQPDVRWSVTIGSPYPAAPRVYSPPPVVYVQPQPVYVHPQPVYVQPAPIVQYGQPYYVEEFRYKKSDGHHHWKHHHRHH